MKNHTLEIATALCHQPGG